MTDMTDTCIHTHHVVPNGHGGWYVRRDDSDELCANTSTKMKAVCIGRELSNLEGSVLFIHERSGEPSPVRKRYPFPVSFRPNWLEKAKLGERVRARDTSEKPHPCSGISRERQ